jgi:hypothetical protein
VSNPKRVFTKSLKVELLESEIASRAIGMAGSHAELARVTQEEAETKKHYKATIARIEAEIDEQATAVNSGFVYQDVECTEVEDWDNKRMLHIRMDTGEEIWQRPMTEEERTADRPLIP